MKTYLPSGAGPCVKAHVVATLVTRTGERYQSTNFCMAPQPECPRVVWGFAPGEGYHLCQQVCKQSGHAEVNAIVAALADKATLGGGTMYVEYKDNTGKVKPWICSSCGEACGQYGIKHVLGTPPEEGIAHKQRQWGAYQQSRNILLGLHE